MKLARRAFLAVAVIALAALAPLNAAHADSKTDYCRFGTKASLFLIDRTTPYDDTDRRVVIDSVGAVIDSLGEGDRIVVATIGSHYSMSERVINACKPGCPRTNNPIQSMLGQCSQMRAMADERDFKSRLRLVIRPLLQATAESPNSDISGTIAQWTQRPPGDRTFTNVYVFSDMLENSQALPWRQFRTLPAADSMAIVRRFGFMPAVRNSEVRIVGFGRLHDPGRPPLPADLDAKFRAFWIDYFQAGGARNVSFEGSILR